MKSFKGFLGDLFGISGREVAPKPGKDRPLAAGPGREPEAVQPRAAPQKTGHFIGRKYEVYRTLGKGGFGEVYLVYSQETASVYALKTFRDEYLADTETRERFRKEAEIWVDLERHPYVVRAFFVDEVAERLYIAMEYIAPDEQGPNSLEGYLARRPPDLAQSLRWAIQFCYGMEYAYSRGVRCHRDIKPANILIGQDKAVKISDFGLAGVLGSQAAMSGVQVTVREGRIGLSGQTVRGKGFGTPTHMPPEQFVDAASCDERSDLYAFGVVLYQMASGGRLPFLASPPRDDSSKEMARFWWEMHRLHSRSPTPELASPLFPLIQRCLQKEPGKRYRSFQDLRRDLESLLKGETGEVIRPPQSSALDAAEWTNKGNSLGHLGRHEEAIRCYDRALALDPGEAATWNNKGGSLGNLGRHEEALRCYDRALKLDPHYADTWYFKGVNLGTLGRHEEAIRCYEAALKIDPANVAAWNNKGSDLGSLGRHEEAIRCYDRALEVDSRSAASWTNKANSLGRVGRHEEAIRCYDRALKLDPLDADASYNRALAEDLLGRRRDAARSYRQCISMASVEDDTYIRRARRRLQELEGR